MRATTFILLALVAVTADGLTAFWLVQSLEEVAPAAATGVGAHPFPLFPDWLPSATSVLFLHLAAVIIGSVCLLAATTAPTSADATARWVLFLAVSFPLPGVGLLVACLIAIALTCTQKRPSNDALFRVGNPLLTPEDGHLAPPSKPHSSPSVIPLTARIRGADLADLRSLAIGLRGLPHRRIATVLERLQRDPDTYLQLYAQGDSADASEVEETTLRALGRYVAMRPDDHRSRYALATHLIYLAAAPHVAIDQRTNFLDLALGHLRDIDSPRAHALRAGIHIRKGERKPAANALALLSKTDPQARSVTVRETAALQAELLHLERRWADLTEHLHAPTCSNDPQFAAVRTFFPAA